jgi:DNA-binding response OmpR family regulator
MPILIVEDDIDLLDILAFSLRRGGHEVLTAHDGEGAMRIFRSKRPRLVLLDIHLPRMSGWDVCRAIRSESDTPIIMLSAADDDDDIVHGLSLGADDYVTKPFSPKQLLARIQAVLRRANDSNGRMLVGWETISAGDIVIEPQRRTVRRDAKEIYLTPIEFKLLYELVLHEGQVLPHKALTDRIWGYDGIDDALLLKGHVRNLRKKLDDDFANPVYIHTVAGVGYLFRRRSGVPSIAP